MHHHAVQHMWCSQMNLQQCSHVQARRTSRPIAAKYRLHELHRPSCGSLLWRVACPGLVVTVNTADSHHTTSTRCSSLGRASKWLSCRSAGLHTPLAATFAGRRPQQHRTITRAKQSSGTDSAGLGSLSIGYLDADDDSNTAGPAFRATLGLLEWPRLCEHVADFASTAVGKRLCKALPVPEAQAVSEQLLQEAK